MCSAQLSVCDGDCSVVVVFAETELLQLGRLDFEFTCVVYSFVQ